MLNLLPREARSLTLRQTLSNENGSSGNQDHVRAAGHSGVQREESRVASHQFHHHGAVVGFGRGVQFVDRFRGGIERGVESEGDLRSADVVIDRFGNSHHRTALGFQFKRDAQRPVAADDQDRVEVKRVQGCHHFVRHIHDDCAAVWLDYFAGKRIAAAGRSEDGSAAGKNSAHVVGGERVDSARFR